MFGLGKANLAENVGAFGEYLTELSISTHFGTVSPLSMFSIDFIIISTEQSKLLYPNSKFGTYVRIRDLAIMRP